MKILKGCPVCGSERMCDCSIEDKRPIICGKFGYCKATDKCPIEQLLTEQAGAVYKIVMPNGRLCQLYYKTKHNREVA